MCVIYDDMLGVDTYVSLKTLYHVFRLDMCMPKNMTHVVEATHNKHDKHVYVRKTQQMST